MIRISSGLWVYNYDPALIPDVDGGGGVVNPPFVFVEPSSLRPVEYVIYVADLTGRVVGELAGVVQEVSWLTDGYGMATILMSPDAAKRAAPLLRFGYRIRIEFSNGVRSWSGIIDPPTETTAGRVLITAYEPAYILDWRTTGTEDVFDGPMARSAVGVMAELVRRSELDIGVSPYLIDDGDAVDITFRNEPLGVAMHKLLKKDPSTHFRVEATGSGTGYIGFELTGFRAQAATGRSYLSLIQDHNLTAWSILDQGPIFNEIRVAAGTPTYGVRPTTAVYASASSLRSVGQHDARVRSVVIPGDGVAAGVAKAELNSFAMPRQRVAGTVRNTASAPYAAYDVGQQILVELHTPQESTYLWTILTMTFRPSSGEIGIVLNNDSRSLTA